MKADLLDRLLFETSYEPIEIYALSQLRDLLRESADAIRELDAERIRLIGLNAKLTYMCEDAQDESEDADDFYEDDGEHRD